MDVYTEALGDGRSFLTRFRIGDINDAVKILWALQGAFDLSRSPVDPKRIIRTRVGTEAYLERMYVQPKLQHKGIGSAAYRQWEATLPPEVTRIRGAAIGSSVQFWKGRGFRWRYPMTLWGRPESERVLEAEMAEIIKERV